MKNTSFFRNPIIGIVLTVTLFGSALLNHCQAQQQNAQWPFYLAFEDGTGAKDTIWCLLDTASTYPNEISGLLGEVPIEPDSINFQVWIYHPLNISSGPPFLRYNTYLKNISDSAGSFTPEIFASNVEVPITVSWDSTLFEADVLYNYGGNPINEATLDNQYLFGFGGAETGWDMTPTDHVELPYFTWGDGEHFPLYLTLRRGPLGTGVGVPNKYPSEFSISPNPASEYILLSFPKVVTAQYKLLNVNGKLMKSDSFSSNREKINLDGLKSGLYFIQVQSGKDKLIKKLVIN